MALALSVLVSGLAVGSMYGLLALGFHLTWSVSRTVNFAQGSSMMLGAVLAYALSVTAAWPLALAVPAALAGCALYGIVVDNLAMFAFGKEPRGMPSWLARRHFEVLGTGFVLLQLVIAAVGLALAAAFAAFKRSRRGRAMLAIVQNERAARLMGIDVENATSAAYAVSTMLAGVAGILIAPLYTVSSTMGFQFGIKAFAVAILGGIDSAWGVVVAGLAFGLAEAAITAAMGSSYTYVLTFGLVIVALALRPQGLFGRAASSKL